MNMVLPPGFGRSDFTKLADIDAIDDDSGGLEVRLPPAHVIAATALGNFSAMTTISIGAPPTGDHGRHF